jgi:UDP-glucose:(heptosyl)LPS alpha-1,3-glucosyltransferase
MLECANFLQEHGHETHIYASEWDENLLDRGVHRHLVSVPRDFSVARTLTFVRRVQKEMRRLGSASPDVVGGYGILAPPGAIIWAGSVHKAWIETSRKRRGLIGRTKQRMNLNHPVILAMEKKYYGERRYKKMIALSDQVKEDLVRLYQVPGDDIEVIPQGFAHKEFNWIQSENSRDKMRSQLGYCSEDKVVIFVANELDRKGFGPLLRSIARMKDTRLSLLVVGRVSAAAYAAEISRLGMTNRVRFTGPAGDVASYYSAADVFALPTQYEPWGLVIVEAMACGLPVLTSRLAGASIAVQEGRNGYLLEDPSSVVEIQEKLAALVRGDLCLSGEAISDSVKSYAWSNILLQYEQVLRDCASPRPKGTR